VPDGKSRVTPLLFNTKMSYLRIALSFLFLFLAIICSLLLWEPFTWLSVPMSFSCRIIG